MSNILTPEEVTFGKTTIPVNDTWGVLDSTKLKTLMSCPMDYFFSYVLGWRATGGNIHLAYGAAWHSALEILQKEGNDSVTVLKAYKAFMKTLKEKMQLPDEVLANIHPSKTPAAAMQGLAEYSALWPDDPKYARYIEVSGTAPISDTRVIHVKLDTIRVHEPGHRNEGKLYSLEHKTTTRYTQAWQEQWEYDFQVGAYDHYLKCLHEPDEVSGVTINGAVFNKTQRKFPRFPVIRAPEMWEKWIYEANHWVNYLEMNMEHLYETSPSDRVMVAFPRNSASCSKFGCKHPQLCCFKANPLQRIENPPLGYHVDFWDPRKRETNPVKQGDVTVSIKTDLTKP